MQISTLETCKKKLPIPTGENERLRVKRQQRDENGTMRGDTTTSQSKRGHIPVEQKGPPVIVRNPAASRGMTMLPSVGNRRVLTVKYRMPLRVIPPHLEERRRRREFEENGGAGKRPKPL